MQMCAAIKMPLNCEWTCIRLGDKVVRSHGSCSMCVCWRCCCWLDDTWHLLHFDFIIQTPIAVLSIMINGQVFALLTPELWANFVASKKVFVFHVQHAWVVTRWAPHISIVLLKRWNVGIFFLLFFARWKLIRCGNACWFRAMWSLINQ